MDATPSAAAGVRSLTLGGLPLLVIALPPTPEGHHVRHVLAEAGLAVLPTFIGVEFPRGARVGVMLEGGEARIVDEEETTLLRMPRAGLDEHWCTEALRLRGTMLGVVADLDVALLADPVILGAALDLQARSTPGGLVGAVVGVHEQRQRLPLLF
jgi:hypothetical protein